ncbi:MAG TPA: hypothetical protein QKA08_04290 [Candidatus Megaira endosymbiont of Nemacystus decipiens]|nr:hypothetical protein [Candidatus Megaera endosymbiont of Nemacystus decipiens]
MVFLFSHNITKGLIINFLTTKTEMNEIKIHFFIIILIAIIIALSVKLYRLMRLIDKKNIELIKYHLDTKFICKHLLESLKTSDPNVFCAEFIKKIKDYYYLEDLIIIDSLYVDNKETPTLLRKSIVKHIRSNIDSISKELSNRNLVKSRFCFKKVEYNIHISKISSLQECAGLIVCVEKSPSLLAVQERNSLENSINLLKNRLFYS